MREQRGTAPAAVPSMAQRIAAFDWDATPLGHMTRWPEPLRATVRTLLEMPLPQALLWGPEFLFCAYNDAYVSLLGKKREALGACFFDVWPEVREPVAPLLHDARHGRSSHFEEAGFALRRGESTEQAYFDFSFSPVRDADAAVIAVLVFAVDVTARVLGRVELDRSVERLRLAAEATGFASYDFDLVEGRSVWSEELGRLTGHESARPVSDEHIMRLVHPDDRERFERAARDAREARASNTRSIEVRIVRPDGAVRWVRDTGRVLVDARTGRATRLVGTLQDITERRQAQDALRESDRAKDEFLAILGHELRNPLAPLRTALDLLQQGEHDPEPLGRLVTMMDRQLSHLTRLVDDLLNVSRISRGEIEVRRMPLALDAVLDAALEQTREAVHTRRHALVVRGPEEQLSVDGDFERLTQVLANLLRNAARYTDPGGHILVEAGRDGEQAVVRVRDDGYGIPPEQLESVFAMFSQVPEHRAKTDGGLGIGLALSRQLVELHGGTVEATSEGPGHGSEFVVRLPLRTRAETAPAREHAAAPASVATVVPRRVLVVDDNVDAARALQRLLDLKGHTAEVAHDGRTALAVLERFEAELVLLDLGLPGLDGLDVARLIRSRPGGGTIRIVAVTGWGQDEDRARTREAGFDEHLTKPIRAAEILALVAATEP